MSIDGKKKEGGGMRVRPSKNLPSKETLSSSDEEENEEDEEEDEYEPESGCDSSENGESPSGETSEEDEASPTPSSSIRGVKRKKEVKKADSKVKAKRVAKSTPKQQVEVQHVPIPAKNEKQEEGGKKGGKKETPTFNDKNVDIDLFHSSPSNVVARKVKVSNNLMVTCRNIDQIDGAKHVGYDFAALTFQRKTANDKMFEFIVPLALSTRIVEAIQHIVQENKKFFKQQI